MSGLDAPAPPRPLTAGDGARLLALAALWGLSFPLQKFAAPVLGAVTIAWTRVAVAGAMLLAVALASRRPLEARRFGGRYALLGLVNTALPFTFFPLAVGSFKTPSSLASVMNATSPLWGAAFGWLWLRDRLRRPQVLGLALGLLGVVLTTEWWPVALGGASGRAAGGSALATAGGSANGLAMAGGGALDSTALVGIGLCLAAAACYGWASVFTKKRLAEAPAMGMAASSQLAATLWLSPVQAASGWPRYASSGYWAIALTIGLACTGLAYLLYYRLILDLGPARALTVTFLIPVFGVLWSRLLLGEAIRPSLLAGGALVLAGTALVTGAWQPGGRGRQGASRAQEATTHG